MMFKAIQKTSRLITVTIGVCLLITTGAFAQNKSVNLAFGDYQQFLAKKQQMTKESKAYQSLVVRADKALKETDVSVMQKKRIAASGNKHDYLSLAPYWWPDPKKDDGLPYIRRDGRVNPTTRGDNVDYTTKEHFFDRVNLLGMAAFYTDDPRYIAGAVKALEVWFVNPETRMTPHLNYAQGVPGRSDGRCYGIIEWLDIDQVLTPIQLLRANNQIPEATYQSLVAWLDAYLKWLQTSRIGIEERDRSNNHGTWYDVQVAGLLLFLDNKDEARKVLEQVKTKRIATQIEPDGRQPQELARTKSLSYSKMNLSAFRRLAALGNKVGIDLLNYETPDGRSIKKASEFINANTNGGKKWPYQQLSKNEQ